MLIPFFVGFAIIASVFYIFFGKKILANFKENRLLKFEKSQEKLAFKTSYQAEKIKMAIEFGKKRARDDLEHPPALDISKKIKPCGREKKRPVCAEHNFIGKNWLDFARHIKDFHKK